MAKRNAKQVDGYVKDDAMSRTKRVAHFLDWAAVNKPGEFMPYNVIVKAIMGYTYMPRLDGDEVRQIKNATSGGVRSSLIGEYNRELVTLPGVGIRATTSDADRLEYVAPRKAQRLATARRNFMLTANAINLRNVPNTPAYAALKSWMQREVGDVLKLIGSAEFERKLLPPSTGPAESNSEK